MKRIISFFIAFIFVFVFSGCEPTTGGSSAKSKSTTTSAPKSKPATTSSSNSNGETGILFDNFGYKDVDYKFEYIPKEDREHYRDLISTEMAKYPDGYYKVIGPYRICLVKTLKQTKPHKQDLGGLAIGKNKTIFISVAIDYLSPDDNNDKSICRSFHHEMQHLAEYSLWGTTDYYWKEYENLYTGSHINTSTTNYTLDYDVPVPKGFLSHYSTLHPKEDRAEIMGYWFAYDSSLILKARNDDILDKKVVLLFTLMRDYFSFPDPLRDYYKKLESPNFPWSW
jgi:hypothetical protein